MWMNTAKCSSCLPITAVACQLQQLLAKCSSYAFFSAETLFFAAFSIDEKFCRSLLENIEDNYGAIRSTQTRSVSFRSSRD